MCVACRFRNEIILWLLFITAPGRALPIGRWPGANNRRLKREVKNHSLYSGTKTPEFHSSKRQFTNIFLETKIADGRENRRAGGLQLNRPRPEATTSASAAMRVPLL